ncbi:MAG: hypothetical protein IKX02_02625 [Spirochaetales bacterium]|nr:hypothetical protein [Spirochaetales bacterium]
MMKITIEFEVAPGNAAELKDLLEKMASLSQEKRGDMEKKGDMETPAPEPEPKPTRTRTRTKKEEPAAPAPEPTSEPAPVAKHPESRQGQPALPTYDRLPEATASPKPKYTVEWVRNLLAEKVGKYRAECKQKLSDLGAANVSSLDPEKYADFVDFLNTLSV